MRIHSHRFGELDVPEETVFRFPEGLVGLGQFKQFVLLEDPESADLIWLQSVEEPRFALATVLSAKLGSEYTVDLQAADCETLKLTNAEEAEILVILNRVDGNFHANLKGPVILNVGAMLGKQVVLHNPLYDVRHAIAGITPRGAAAGALAELSPAVV